MRRFRGGYNSLRLRERHAGFKGVELAVSRRFDYPVVIQFADNRVHAVISQSAGVHAARHEVGAEGVHFGNRAHVTHVAVIIRVNALRKRRARGAFRSDYAGVGFALQFVSDKREGYARKVAAAAGAGDDDVGIHVYFFKLFLRFETDNGLVHRHMVEHAAEGVVGVASARGVFHRLADGYAQIAVAVGVFSEIIPAELRQVGRAGGHAGAESLHKGAAHRLLVVTDFNHIHLAFQTEMAARHAERRAPLSRARFGGEPFYARRLVVIRLRHGGIEFVAAGGVVALVFIKDFRRGAQHSFQTVSPVQVARSVSVVDVLNFVRDIDVSLLAYSCISHSPDNSRRDTGS